MDQEKQIRDLEGVLLKESKIGQFDDGIGSYMNSGGSLPSEWQRSASITDFVNIVHLMAMPSERPLLFKQLKSAVQDTIHYWASASDLNQ